VPDPLRNLRTLVRRGGRLREGIGTVRPRAFPRAFADLEHLGGRDRHILPAQEPVQDGGRIRFQRPVQLQVRVFADAVAKQQRQIGMGKKAVGRKRRLELVFVQRLFRYRIVAAVNLKQPYGLQPGRLLDQPPPAVRAHVQPEAEKQPALLVRRRIANLVLAKPVVQQKIKRNGQRPDERLIQLDEHFAVQRAQGEVAVCNEPVVFRKFQYVRHAHGGIRHSFP